MSIITNGTAKDGPVVLSAQKMNNRSPRKSSKIQNSLDNLLLKRLQETAPPVKNGSAAPSDHASAVISKLDKPIVTSMAKKSPSSTDPAAVKTTVGTCLVCRLAFDDAMKLLEHIQHHVPHILKLTETSESTASRDFKDATVQEKLLPDSSSAVPTVPSHDTLMKNLASLPFITKPQENESIIPTCLVPASSLFMDSTHLLSSDSSTFKRKNGYLMCPLCCSTFGTDTEYTKHMETHESDIRSGQPSILKTLSSLIMVDPSSSKEGNDPAAFKCSRCPAKFADINRYQDHLEGVHDLRLDEGVQCQICGLSFPSDFERNRHMGSHTGATHHCLKCGGCFNQKMDLLLHKSCCSITLTDDDKTSKLNISTEKLIPNEKSTKTIMEPSICSECGDSFQDKTEFENHKATHGNINDKANNPRETPDSTDPLNFHTEPTRSRASSQITSDTEESEAVPAGSVYPKYKPVTHSMENDYLNGILQGITKRSPTKRVHRKRRRRKEESSDAKQKRCVGEVASSDSNSDLRHVEADEETVSSSCMRLKSNLENSSKAPPTEVLNSTPPPPNSPLNLVTNESSPEEQKKSCEELSPPLDPTDTIIETGEIEGPLQNDYFKNLVESNVKKYSRQRLRDPMDNYMLTKMNS